MKLTFADLQAIRDDEIQLKKLTDIVHTTYALLCALCRLDYSTMNKPDDDDDDDDDEDVIMSASRELIIAGDMSELSDLKMSLGKELAELENDAGLYDEHEFERMRKAIEERMGTRTERQADDDDFIEFEGQKSKKGDSYSYSMKDLFRMIRQASHPDKIMRFSAETKSRILDCFHDAKEHYADDNYPAMVLCYIEIFLLRGDPRPINYYLWKYAKQRHIQIEANLKFIMEKPYMPAITAYRKGNVERAKKLFKEYWATTQADPMDDMDCFK
jgi:hypothetical protein